MKIPVDPVPDLLNKPELCTKFPNKLIVPAKVVEFDRFNVPPSIVKVPSTFKIPAPAAEPTIRVPAVKFKLPATPKVIPFCDQLVVAPPLKIKLLYCLAGLVKLVVKTDNVQVVAEVLEYLTVLPVIV